MRLCELSERVQPLVADRFPSVGAGGPGTPICCGGGDRMATFQASRALTS